MSDQSTVDILGTRLKLLLIGDSYSLDEKGVVELTQKLDSISQQRKHLEDIHEDLHHRLGSVIKCNKKMEEQKEDLKREVKETERMVSEERKIRDSSEQHSLKIAISELKKSLVKRQESTFDCMQKRKRDINRLTAEIEKKIKCHEEEMARHGQDNSKTLMQIEHEKAALNQEIENLGGSDALLKIGRVKLFCNLEKEIAECLNRFREQVRDKMDIEQKLNRTARRFDSQIEDLRAQLRITEQRASKARRELDELSASEAFDNLGGSNHE